MMMPQHCRRVSCNRTHKGTHLLRVKHASSSYQAAAKNVQYFYMMISLLCRLLHHVMKKLPKTPVVRLSLARSQQSPLLMHCCERKVLCLMLV